MTSKQPHKRGKGEPSPGPGSFAYWRRFDRTAPGGWVALVLRLGLAAVWLIAGLVKITDLSGSVRSVYAFKILPYGLSQVVGAAQPMLEILLGVTLLVGVAVRLVAAISTVLLVVYIAGIISVWVRGLRIDCGCFSSGGTLAAGQTPSYGWDILRDSALVVLALLVFLWPRSRFALDSRLMYSEEF
jgi:uncharacterized membrane protein YphA (DoxX/SURF4 family)